MNNELFNLNVNFMQYQIFNTCGTSVLTNPARSNDDLRKILTKMSNAQKESDLTPEQLSLVQKHWSDLVSDFSKYTPEMAQEKSAELNCLLTWQKKNNIRNSDCLCHLIHTDTLFGELSAQIIEDWLKKNGYQDVMLTRIECLCTASVTQFEEGLSNLAQWAFEQTEYHRDDLKYIFNIAGGFKSISGFTQILGQFLADETIYIFEGGGSVLSMPKLPVVWSEIDAIKKHFDEYHRIALGLPLDSYSNLNNLWVKNGNFTPWGQLAWENAKRELYRQKVYNIVYENVVEGKSFRSSIVGLDGEKTKQLNERLDDLCTYKMGNAKHCLKRLDYKKLKTMHNNCTHECDAWADKDCRRLFCNEQNNTIIVELLGKPLH